MRSVETLGILAFLVAGPAHAAIITTPFAPSVYNPNTAAMDAALGITGFTIEDFEDTTLVSGLTYTLGAPVNTTFSALPALSTPFSFPFADNFWDGPGVLVNSSTNQAVNNPATNLLINTDVITFNIAGGATSFGIGLGNFQSASGNPFPFRDHELFVNGSNLGDLESLAGWVPGLPRNLYLRVDATGADVINSVGFVTKNGGREVLIFDHAAIQFAGPAAVIPEPTSLAVFGIGAAVGLFGYSRRRRKKVA